MVLAYPGISNTTRAAPWPAVVLDFHNDKPRLLSTIPLLLQSQYHLGDCSMVMSKFCCQFHLHPIGLLWTSAAWHWLCWNMSQNFPQQGWSLSNYLTENHRFLIHNITWAALIELLEVIQIPFLRLHKWGLHCLNISQHCFLRPLSSNMQCFFHPKVSDPPLPPKNSPKLEGPVVRSFTATSPRVRITTWAGPSWQNPHVLGSPCGQVYHSNTHMY